MKKCLASVLSAALVATGPSATAFAAIIGAAPSAPVPFRVASAIPVAQGTNGAQPIMTPTIINAAAGVSVAPVASAQQAAPAGAVLAAPAISATLGVIATEEAGSQAVAEALNHMIDNGGGAAATPDAVVSVDGVVAANGLVRASAPRTAVQARVAAAVNARSSHKDGAVIMRVFSLISYYVGKVYDRYAPAEWVAKSIIKKLEQGHQKYNAVVVTTKAREMTAKHDRDALEAQRARLEAEVAAKVAEAKSAADGTVARKQALQDAVEKQEEHDRVEGQVASANAALEVATKSYELAKEERKAFFNVQAERVGVVKLRMTEMRAGQMQGTLAGYKQQYQIDGQTEVDKLTGKTNAAVADGKAKMDAVNSGSQAQELDAQNKAKVLRAKAKIEDMMKGDKKADGAMIDLDSSIVKFGARAAAVALAVWNPLTAAAIVAGLLALPFVPRFRNSDRALAARRNAGIIGATALGATVILNFVGLPLLLVGGGIAVGAAVIIRRDAALSARVAGMIPLAGRSRFAALFDASSNKTDGEKIGMQAMAYLRYAEFAILPVVAVIAPLTSTLLLSIAGLVAILLPASKASWGRRIGADMFIIGVGTAAAGLGIAVVASTVGFAITSVTTMLFLAPAALGIVLGGLTSVKNYLTQRRSALIDQSAQAHVPAPQPFDVFAAISRPAPVAPVVVAAPVAPVVVPAAPAGPSLSERATVAGQKIADVSGVAAAKGADTIVTGLETVADAAAKAVGDSSTAPTIKQVVSRLQDVGNRLASVATSVAERGVEKLEQLSDPNRVKSDSKPGLLSRAITALRAFLDMELTKVESAPEYQAHLMQQKIAAADATFREGVFNAAKAYYLKEIEIEQFQKNSRDFDKDIATLIRGGEDQSAMFLIRRKRDADLTVIAYLEAMKSAKIELETALAQRAMVMAESTENMIAIKSGLTQAQVADLQMRLSMMQQDYLTGMSQVKSVFTDEVNKRLAAGRAAESIAKADPAVMLADARERTRVLNIEEELARLKKELNVAK